MSAVPTVMRRDDAALRVFDTEQGRLPVVFQHGLGGDANHWLDVRNSLPLLTQERWYARTKHGYARGYEAVAYVGNVRTYFDMLSWITSGSLDRRKQPQLEQEPPLQTPAGVLKHRDDPLHINSPIL